jgi:hypothetical protein
MVPPPIPTRAEITDRQARGGIHQCSRGHRTGLRTVTEDQMEPDQQGEQAV